MILKNEDLQALGMITVALGLSMGWVLDQLHLDFSILRFLEGLFIGLSMGCNLTYLWRGRQGRERSESVELASGQINSFRRLAGNPTPKANVFVGLPPKE